MTILKVGDVVEVKVINVEKDGKIGLSIKKAIDRPERPVRSDRGRSRDSRGVIQVVHVMGQGDQMITIVHQRKTLNQKWRAF